MVSLTNGRGVKVEVSEDTASRLGPEWAPVKSTSTKKPASRKAKQADEK